MVQGIISALQSIEGKKTEKEGRITIMNEQTVCIFEKPVSEEEINLFEEKYNFPFPA
ncbi:hypothetical protein [Brevibacillus nitrificans]|uniref:hypothetical protein n=1 Tax=Brevibacillus nitrificans TaxID=651560 RepID=UPI002862ACB1|nr:hypothetical protein [Brevibacillus nitrificans]MDR7318101.1 hypothetical protein [Brevibacillus nitrificans]